MERASLRAVRRDIMANEDHPIELVLEGVKLSAGNLDLLGLLANKLGEAPLNEDEVGAISDEMFSQLDMYSRNRKVVDLCLVVLSNLTVVEANCEIFVSKEVADGDTMDKVSASKRLESIIESFLKHNPQAEDGELDYTKREAVIQADPWAHVASVLCNLSRTGLGRKLILKVSNDYFPKIASQFRSLNIVRRQGCVGTIRTCLFDSEVHWWALHEAKILPHILYPLVVATPFEDKDKEGMDPRIWMAAEDKNKKYEPDVGVRKMLLECLVLLCQKKPQRDDLRRWKVYPVCRNLDLEQEDESVSEVILDIVNFLMRDEEGERSGWDAPLALETTNEDKNRPKGTADTAANAPNGNGVFSDMGVD